MNKTTISKIKETKFSLKHPNRKIQRLPQKRKIEDVKKESSKEQYKNQKENFLKILLSQSDEPDERRKLTRK